MIESPIPRPHTPLVKTKFHWTIWWWTNGDESLFNLTPFECELFNDFVREASQ